LCIHAGINLFIDLFVCLFPEYFVHLQKEFNISFQKKALENKEEKGKGKELTCSRPGPVASA